MGTVSQTTIDKTVRFEGIALHSGHYVRMSIHPAEADFGVVFERSDLDGSLSRRRILAGPEALVETSLCTRLENPDGVTVSTTEHLMAALAGCGIHNALVRLDGGELPILDGSARDFARGLCAAGARLLDAPLRVIRLRRAIEVGTGDSWARLEPAPHLSIAFEIDFPDAAIGRQHKELAMVDGAFLRELADSRTFCRWVDVDWMRANGLALGGSLDNAVVVDGAEVLTPGGLRHPDEPVRHKMLDVMGDLSVAGAPILGRYIGHRAGHALTARLLRTLMADPSSHDRIEIGSADASCLPGCKDAVLPSRVCGS